MKRHQWIQRIFVLLFAVSSNLVFAADWYPITPAELSQKDSIVEKGADAEVILWEVRLSDERRNNISAMVKTQYFRVKIFTNRGRDRWSNINIPIRTPTQILGLMARTIQPDGTIQEVDKDAIFERAPDKNGTGVSRLKRKSFTFPGVQPGSIIEYRYREETERGFQAYHRLDFQLDVPIQEVRYYIKPYTGPGFQYQMYLLDFHCPHSPPTREINGFESVTLRNVPAFRPEPNMPPENELRAWSLVYYRSTLKIDPDEFWKDYGKKLYNIYKPHMKVTPAVRDKAAEITAKGATPNEKLLLLVDFCRTHVKNSQTEAVSAEEREDLQANKTPEDTLNQGVGTPQEIRELFGALASAIGYEAHMAAVPRRDNVFFSRTFPDSYFLSEREMAVNIDGTWHFYDPGNTSIPRDMLVWRHEGVDALISDPKDPVFVTTPLSTADKSIAHREGHFRLAEDGTLEGDVVMQYSGHPGAVWKEQSQHRSDAQREEAFKNVLKRYVSNAEFSAITIENVNDPDKPLTYRGHIRVPNYAQRTGKRLFFAPSFFQQGIPPLYPLKDRKYPVYIHWPWTDEDKVTFELPSGFEPESPQIPPSLPLGALGKYEVKARIVNKTQFVFERRFIFGEHALLVPVETYPALKDVLDAVSQNDQQTITLKIAATPN